MNQRFQTIKKAIGEILMGLAGSWFLYGIIILIEIMTGNLGYEHGPYETEFDIFALVLIFSIFLYLLLKRRKYVAFGVLLFLIFNEVSLIYIEKLIF